MKTIDELQRLEKELRETPIPRADRSWVGADVIIRARTPPQVTRGGFYPEPRSVVTPHSRELSWLFERLRDAFYAESRLDSCSKIEFFGRLANAANRCLLREPAANARLLCTAVLHEAFSIYEEMEESTFRFLEVAIGNEILDDYVDEALRSGFLGIEETAAFFARHGVEQDGE